MNITDPKGNPPVTALAPFTQATYRLSNLPQGPGTVAWTLSGDISALSTTGATDTDQLTLIARQRSQQANASVLTATFTPQNQGSPTMASLGLTVFELAIAMAPPTAEDAAESLWMGVGETRVLSASTLPSGVVNDQAAQWQWAVGADLQIMGNANGPAATVVANSATNNAGVAVALGFAGGTAQAQQQLVTCAVQITGADGGPPPCGVPVGLPVGYQVQVQPSPDDAQLFWTGSGGFALAVQGTAAVLQGVQPSSAEGADGLAVNVLMNGAQAHAVIPVTVYASAITAPGGTPALTQLPANGRQRYAVSTAPPLAEVTVSWAVLGPAALTGATTQAEVELVTLGPSESAGDIVLGVSVLPPGMAHPQPTAVLHITAGTPRR